VYKFSLLFIHFPDVMGGSVAINSGFVAHEISAIRRCWSLAWCIAYCAGLLLPHCVWTWSDKTAVDKFCSVLSQQRFGSELGFDGGRPWMDWSCGR